MRHIDIRQLADDARFSRLHGRVLFWCALIILVDGYDLAVAGVALPSIMKDMGVDGTTAGFMASSALFGMAFGAMFLGTLADKIGRRWTISICIFLFSAFTAAAGFTTEPISFSTTRFIAGLGLGGVMPNITAAMTEYAPRKLRARLVTLMFCGYALGGILAALIGKQFIEVRGWQSVFFAAGLPLVLIPLILKNMPESLAYLVARGDDTHLRQIANQLQPGLAAGTADRFVVPAEDAGHAGASIGQLFQDGRGVSTAMFWIAFFTGLFTMYALGSWLTKLMAMAGYSLGSALTFTIVFNAGSIVGALAGGWLGDKLNIKWVLAVMWALGAVALALMGHRLDGLALMGLIALVGATTAGTQALAYAYIGQFYPMAIRSTGIGMASGIGRAGGIAAPIIIGFLVSLQLPLPQNFLAIALACAVGAVAIACVNHRRCASLHGGDAAEAPAAAALARGRQPMPQAARRHP